MLGPEGVTRALVKHAERLVPEGLRRVREQRGLNLQQLPELHQITGYEPHAKTLGMFPMLSFQVEDTTGRLDTRRVVDSGEGDLYIRMYRATAKTFVASQSEVETVQALHRYALAVRDGLQLIRGIRDEVPVEDSLEITTRQTTERYSGTTEQNGRFVATASFVFYLRAEEFVPAIQGPLAPGPVGGVNINVGGGPAGRDEYGDLVPGGVSSAAPLIDRMTLGASPTPDTEA